MTLHKLSAGHGYTYLTRQVAANDAHAEGYANLAEYYSERGEAPGVWLGRGLDGLGEGPAVGSRVDEAQMIALFGHGRQPNDDTPLGRPFTVTVGTVEFHRELAQRIRAHNLAEDRPAAAPIERAVRARLRTELASEWFARDHGRSPADAGELTDYLTARTRRGRTSVAGFDLTFSPVKSVSALWALSNPEIADQVAAAHDAAVRDVVGWLEDTAIYARRGHNGPRQVDVGGLLAVAFVHRDSRTGDPDLHTHVAISNKVRAADGTWLAIDGRPLHKAAVAASERYNTRLEMHLGERLGVVFADRPNHNGKRPVREIVGLDPELLARWSSRRQGIETRHAQLAREFTAVHGRHPDAKEHPELYTQATLTTRPDKHAPRSLFDQRAEWWAEAADVLGSDAAVDAMLAGVSTVAPLVTSADWAERAGRRAVATISAERATWQECHIRAEIERLARADRLRLADADARVDAAVAVALADVSIKLGGLDDGIPEPSAMRRRDGSSVFTVAGAQLYTSRPVLEAESRILHAAALIDGRRVPDGIVELGLLEARAHGRALTAEQEELVRDLATWGRRVQLALAPAGTGKTTALGELARSWREDGGTVVGLAPTASAAAQLRAALDGPTDTIAKLLHGVAAGGLPAGLDAINDRTLVIIDEAGAAGTLDLDRTIAHVLNRGGSVRLVGDDQQLSSVASGGVLRDLARRYGAVSLATPLRFTDPVEGYASLALRQGDPVALGYYLDHERIHAGDHGSAVDDAFAAWRADAADGRTSLMLAATNEAVCELNLRARAERSVEGPEVALADGTRAAAGDLKVSRRNNRRLPISSSDWVKNGDRWRVLEVESDGAMQAVHLASRRTVRLPAEYGVQHVQLGYATTIHQAQGSTADTCHVVLTGRESREDLYVAVTRGRNGNHAYVGLDANGPHDAAGLTAEPPATSTEILERILAREGSQRSATSQHDLDTDVARRLRQAAERYREAVLAAPGVPTPGDGPLPWLAATPLTADEVWTEYLEARHALVSDLAQRVDGYDLPPQAWSPGLRRADPDLAREVAVWRGASGCEPCDPRPCGPPDCDAPAYRRELASRVSAVLDAQLVPADRWRPIVEQVEPRLVIDAGWAGLAKALDDAARTGYDVAAQLPTLVRQRALPTEHAARAMTYRLADACPESIPHLRPHVDAEASARTRMAVEAARAMHRPTAPSRGVGR